MDREFRANLRRLGFTSREIDTIDEEKKALASREPSRELSPSALRMRRYRARQAASRDKEKLPGWARKKKAG